MTGGHEKRCTVTSVNLEYDVEKQWGTYTPHFDLFLTVECNVHTQRGEIPSRIELKGKLKKELENYHQNCWRILGIKFNKIWVSFRDYLRVIFY